MSIPVGEYSRRVLVRTLVDHTELVHVRDDDPDDEDGDPDLVTVLEPPGLLNKSFRNVGLTDQDQVEVFRDDLKIRLPEIEDKLSERRLGPGSNLGVLRDFLTAALDEAGA